MTRNLVFVITMTAAALGQTPSVVEKPSAKASTVKVSKAPAESAKPSPGKSPFATPQSQPRVVSVAPRPNQSSSAAPKPVRASAAKPAAPGVVSKPALVPAIKVAVSGAKAVSKPTPAKPGTTPPTVSLAEEQSKPKDKEASQQIHLTGRRDPFISPVVNLGAVGSGCSTGKRCLAIDQILLRGVVKSESGMIAVVVNALDKAYFLRENDPVFNGYVLKITGDSIVFKETFRDRLGKPLTRDVTKTITRPVA